MVPTSWHSHPCVVLSHKVPELVCVQQNMTEEIIWHSQGEVIKDCHFCLGVPLPLSSSRRMQLPCLQDTQSALCVKKPTWQGIRVSSQQLCQWTWKQILQLQTAAHIGSSATVSGETLNHNHPAKSMPRFLTLKTRMIKHCCCFKMPSIFFPSPAAAFSCASTRDQTCDPSVHRTMLQPMEPRQPGLRC